MAQNIHARSNPDNLETKKNHLRQWVRHLLAALGLEQLLGVRLKNMLKAEYIPREESAPVADLPVAKKAEMDAPAESVEEPILGTLISALQAAIKTFVKDVKARFHKKINQAVQQGQLTEVAAKHLRTAANDHVNESLVQDAVHTMLNPEAPMTKEELDNIPRPLRKLVKEVDKEYQQRAANTPRPTPNTPKKSSDPRLQEALFRSSLKRQQTRIIIRGLTKGGVSHADLKGIERFLRINQQFIYGSPSQTFVRNINQVMQEVQFVVNVANRNGFFNQPEADLFEAFQTNIHFSCKT